MRASQYARIADILKERIRRGEYSDGTPLESQKELSKIFGTSIMTVRQAISVLEKEGLIEVAQGLGTFVNPGSVKGFDFKLKGFSDDMERYRRPIFTRILRKEFGLREERTRLALGIEEGSFCRTTRLRIFGGEPIIVQRSSLSSEYEDIVRGLSDDMSLYASVNEKTGGVVEGRKIIAPIALGKEEAAFLREEPGTLALLSSRISLEVSGKPIVFDEAYLRSGYVLCAVRELGSRRSFNYDVPAKASSDPISLLREADFWEES